MNVKDPISIRKVKNGYIIEPSHFNYFSDASAGFSNDDIMVFNKIEDLNSFMFDHFEPKEIDNRKIHGSS